MVKLEVADSDIDTPDDYFFFVLFSVLFNGLFRMYAIFRQVK